MGQRRRFTPEFKRQAVQLLNAGQRPAADIARELGIPRNRLYKWQKAVAVHGGGLPRLRPPSRADRRDHPTSPGAGPGHRGARHLKRSRRVLCAGVHVKYAFIPTQASHHRITGLCHALGVSRSGYYAWHDRPPSARTLEDERLLPLLRQIHMEMREQYGAVKLWWEAKGRGIRCGRHRVVRLRKLGQLETKRVRRFRVIVEHHQLPPPAPNLLEQRFVETTLNRIWVGDSTLVTTRAGWLYVAVLLDLCSRWVIGWAMREKPDQQLTLEALAMAVHQRRMHPGLMHHSDRGAQYSGTRRTSGSVLVSCMTQNRA